MGRFAKGFRVGTTPDVSTFYVIEREIDRIYRALNALGDGTGGGAPVDAEYLLGVSNSVLTAGRVVAASATVAWDLTTPLFASAYVIDNSITDGKLRQGAALSVIGRASNSVGNVADIVAAVASTVLKRNASNVLGFDKVDLGADVSGTLPASSVSGLGHAMLSTTHTDSQPYSPPVAGDLMVALTGVGSEIAAIDAWFCGLPFGDLADEGSSGGADYWLDGLPYDSADAVVAWTRLPVGPTGAYLRVAGGAPVWDADPLRGVWQSYVGAWTSTGGTQPNLGDGTLESRYARNGDTIDVNILLTIGTTTTFGTGIWVFLLPTSLRSLFETGICQSFDADTTARTAGYAIPITVTTVAVGNLAGSAGIPAAGAWQATSPIAAPAVGDKFSVTIKFEEA